MRKAITALLVLALAAPLCSDVVIGAFRTVGVDLQRGIASRRALLV